MGLFDKIKSLANAVTGGAAKVTVTALDARFGAPFEVVVRAQSQGAEVKYNKVYLKIEGVEEVELPETESERPETGAGTDTEKRRREPISASATLLALDFTVAGAGVLKENAAAEWKMTVELPKNSAPEYNGTHAKHYYRIFAGLDCVGNDPDSGWNRLNLSGPRS